MKSRRHTSHNVCQLTTDAEGREEETHGTPSFPLAYFRLQVERACIIPHWHDDFEMMVMTEGNCALNIGTEEYLLSAGQGFFVNAGVLHCMQMTKAAESGVFVSLVFHPRFVGGGMESVFWRRYVEPVLSNRDMKGVWLSGSESWHADANAAILSAWNACAAQQFGYEFAAREALSKMFLLLLSNFPAPPRRPTRKAVRDDERVKSMMQFIREHYAEDIRIEDLCRCASISESECLRCFRSTIGTTPMQYVRDYRMDVAAAMLLETDLNAGDIAGQCGFSDPSYFSKCFRVWSGVSPSQYRKSGRAAF